MTWETIGPEPEPTEAQIDYIDSLFEKLNLHHSEIIWPATMKEASEMIDQLKEELGWTE